MEYFQKETTLQRIVNKNTRYIKVNIFATLFEDLFMLEVIYGAVRNKKPTGKKQIFFNTYNSALKQYEKYIHLKKKRGYVMSYKDIR